MFCFSWPLQFPGLICSEATEEIQRERQELEEKLGRAIGQGAMEIRDFGLQNCTFDSCYFGVVLLVTW